MKWELTHRAEPSDYSVLTACIRRERSWVLKVAEMSSKMKTAESLGLFNVWVTDDFSKNSFNGVSSGDRSQVGTGWVVKGKEMEIAFWKVQFQRK